MRAEADWRARIPSALFADFFAIFAVKDFDREERKDRKVIL